jgi:MFS family permease
MADRISEGARPDPSSGWVRILPLLCGAATVAYVQRQCLGTVEKPIREELGLSFAEMGSVQASFFLTYAVLQIPAGWGAQRWGIRKSLLAMAVVWSLACALIPLVRGTSDLVTLRLLMGAAQAGIFTCTTLAVRRFFDPTQYGLANGVIAGSMQLGGFLGAVLAGWVTGVLGWRGMFLVFALPGFAWAVWFWRWFPRTSGEASAGGDSAPINAATWWSLICAWPLWCLSCQQFLRAGAQMFFGSWFATYLQEARGLDLTQAGFLTGIPIAAAAFGPLAGGWAADRLLVWSGSRRVSRQGLASGCLLLCALLMFLGYRATQPLAGVALIGVGAFFAAAAGPAAYTSTMDLGGTRLALVFSVMNMWGNVGAAAFPKVIGQMLGAASQRVGGTSGAWGDVFAVFITLYVLAALAWLPFHIRRPIGSADPVPDPAQINPSPPGQTASA